ncbi:MAG TPA: TetR/AcrR family transcriptional regulator [Marmoricola sp.]|nr:TetR/AcrR family transcriptional regulator [Marmoricola sp.]
MATRELLAEDGYTALNFSLVARRAGVTRQLLYRWWPEKASLVSEAMFGSGVAPWPSDYSGDLLRDLRTFLQAVVDYACRPDVRAGVVGLMADADASTPLPGLVDGFLQPLHESLAALVAANDTRPGIDVALTLNTIRGAVVMHLLADQTPPDVVVAHVSDLMHGALRLP